jgi:hypothetical protein
VVAITNTLQTATMRGQWRECWRWASVSVPEIRGIRHQLMSRWHRARFVGIQGCWCQPYLGSTVHAKGKDDSVWSAQNIRDTNPSNRRGVGLRVRVCTHLLAWYLRKKKPQDIVHIPRGDVATSSLVVVDPRLPDSAWQVVRSRYWDLDLYPRAFRDRVNLQEGPSHSDERKAMDVPKAEADLQTAYHKLKESSDSDRENQGHG